MSSSISPIRCRDGARAAAFARGVQGQAVDTTCAEYSPISARVIGKSNLGLQRNAHLFPKGLDVAVRVPGRCAACRFGTRRPLKRRARWRGFPIQAPVSARRCANCAAMAGGRSWGVTCGAGGSGDVQVNLRTRFSRHLGPSDLPGCHMLTCSLGTPRTISRSSSSTGPHDAPVPAPSDLETVVEPRWRGGSAP